MFIGTIIKEHRQKNNQSVEDFAAASGLTVEVIQTLESLYTEGTQEPVPIAMRQLKAISDVIGIPVPMLMMQIGSDQPVEVNVVAESDQPHAK